MGCLGGACDLSIDLSKQVFLHSKHKRETCRGRCVVRQTGVCRRQWRLLSRQHTLWSDLRRHVARHGMDVHMRCRHLWRPCVDDPGPWRHECIPNFIKGILPHASCLALCWLSFGLVGAVRTSHRLADSYRLQLERTCGESR